MVERRGTKALELWCKRVTDGYPGVKIENMTTSWRDGLAFCALIHHFRPDLIDFSTLDKSDIYGNNELAFRTAERHLSIPALLDANDMVQYEIPDRLSILTYLSQFYQVFASQDTASSPVKRSPPNSLDADGSIMLPSGSQTSSNKLAAGVGNCRVCSCPVYLAQRLLIDKHLYHRCCFRCARCKSQLSAVVDYYQSLDGRYCCEICPDQQEKRSVELSMELSIDNNTHNHNNKDASDVETSPVSSPSKTTSLVSSRKALFERLSYVGDKIDFELTDDVKASLRNRNGVNDELAADNNESSNHELSRALLSTLNIREDRNIFFDSHDQTLSSYSLSLSAASSLSEISSTLAPPISSSVSELRTHCDDDDRRQWKRLDTAVSHSLPNIINDSTEIDDVRNNPGTTDADDFVKSNEQPSATTDSDYPEQFNPFKDESDDDDRPAEVSSSTISKLSSAKKSTNPFDSDDACDDDNVPRKNHKKESINNPFWSDSEEERAYERELAETRRCSGRGKQLRRIDKATTAVTNSLTASPNTVSKDASPTCNSAYSSNSPLASSYCSASSPNLLTSGLSSADHSSWVSSSTPRKKKHAPPPPVITMTKLPSSEAINQRLPDDQSTSHVEIDHDVEETSAKVQDANTSSNFEISKSTHAKWKRKKGPAPSRPVPQRRNIQIIPTEEIKRELVDIEIRQQELERQGVKLEQMIRESTETAAEEMVLQLFELVNEKNELFRKHSELMHKRKLQNLELEHAELEYQIRCLMLRPESNKTDNDKQREEELIQRLVEVVEKRNEIIETMENDRIREVAENNSVFTQLANNCAIIIPDRIVDGQTDDPLRTNPLIKSSGEKTKTHRGASRRIHLSDNVSPKKIIKQKLSTLKRSAKKLHLP